MKCLSRQGTVYVVVLVIVSLSALIGLSGLTVARMERKTALGMSLAGSAGENARAGIDMALERVAGGVAWRGGTGQLVAAGTQGVDGIAVGVIDPVDGVLGDGACEDVEMLSEGWNGDAYQALRLSLYHKPESVTSAMVLALRPVSYWPMHSVSGVAADYRLVSNGLVGVGVVVNGGVGSVCWGAPRFTGSVGSFIEIAHDAGYLLDRGSVSLWVKSGMTTTAGLFSKNSGSSATGDMLEITLESRRIHARVGSQNGNEDIWSGKIDNTWHHVVVTFGERGFELWLDGVLSDSWGIDYCWSNRTGLTGNVQPIVIGARTAVASIGLADNITDNHVGYIREVALFAYQLEGADIAMLALEAPVAWPLVPVPNTMERVIR